MSSLDDKNSLSPWYALAIFVVPLTIWLLNLWFMHEFFDTPTDRGLAGDMFGASTSLFSGFAFAGLIVTLLLQRTELQLQRKELELARAEYKNLVGTQKQQLNVMQQQLEFDRIQKNFRPSLHWRSRSGNTLNYSNPTQGICILAKIEVVSKDKSKTEIKLERVKIIKPGKEFNVDITGPSEPMEVWYWFYAADGQASYQVHYLDKPGPQAMSSVGWNTTIGGEPLKIE